MFAGDGRLTADTRRGIYPAIVSRTISLIIRLLKIMRDMVGFYKSRNKLNYIVILSDIPISRQKQNFYAYTRADHHAGSFSVSLMDDLWHDFTTGDGGGDLVALGSSAGHVPVERVPD